MRHDQPPWYASIRRALTPPQNAAYALEVTTEVDTKNGGVSLDRGGGGCDDLPITAKGGNRPPHRRD